MNTYRLTEHMAMKCMNTQFWIDRNFIVPLVKVWAAYSTNASVDCASSHTCGPWMSCGHDRLLQEKRRTVNLIMANVFLFWL